jgi:hypothetical protein
MQEGGGLANPTPIVVGQNPRGATQPILDPPELVLELRSEPLPLDRVEVAAGECLQPGAKVRPLPKQALVGELMETRGSRRNGGALGRYARSAVKAESFDRLHQVLDPSKPLEMPLEVVAHRDLSQSDFFYEIEVTVLAASSWRASAAGRGS